MADRRVFVPGHVTAFFTVHEGDDPTETGSQGAGLTLTDGVRVGVEPANTTVLELDGDRIACEPVERALDALDVTARVEAESDLPIGAGFGVSGALTLGAVLAANRAFDRRLSENESAAVAHGAEVQSGTGLGDVAAQARGGLPIRLEPGDPFHGQLDGIPGQFRVEYVTFGELDTRETLDRDYERLNRAGKEGLSLVVDDPTVSTLMRAGRQFARETELLTGDVLATIEEVTAAGGEASMSMLGETVFAPGTGLSDAGYDPEVCRTSRRGAGFE
jgi:pantoate kinase